MPRAGAGTTLYLLLMLLAGGRSLFACVFLPPWLELRTLRQERDAARVLVEQLDQRLARAIEPRPDDTMRTEGLREVVYRWLFRSAQPAD